MSKPRRVRIDLNRLRAIAHTGLQRAYVFMGYGLNAARDANLNDFSLEDVSHAQLVSPFSAPTQIESAKQAFGQWIVGGGIREAIEAFGTFLDEVHRVALFVAGHKGAISEPEARKARKRFRHIGLPEKLAVLVEGFGVGVEWPALVGSIHSARNCLVHRHGVVAKKDCNAGEQLAVSWRSLELVILRATGEVVIRMPIQEKVHVEQGEAIAVQWSTRESCFDVGDALVLHPSHLAEICVYLYMETNYVCQRLSLYLKSQEIPDRQDA